MNDFTPEEQALYSACRDSYRSSLIKAREIIAKTNHLSQAHLRSRDFDGVKDADEDDSEDTAIRKMMTVRLMMRAAKSLTAV